MSPDNIADLMREAVFLIVLMVTVILVPSLIVGLIVSIFQAATQINEQTLSFFPRLVVTFGTLIIFGGWLASELIDFTLKIIHEIPSLIG
ncbi:Flagellar biosynthesis protein FliQ [gamma proteobacterium HdN1]|nr:Flagellar biosynthesis protein FliQ [gamma proteobacterium HdN1]